MRLIMKTLLSVLLLAICVGINTAQAFELGKATIASNAGEPLVVRIPIYDMKIDGYSTLAGSIEGYHEAIDSMTYRVMRYNDHHLFIIRSNEPIRESFEARVILSYRDMHAERLIYIVPEVASIRRKHSSIRDQISLINSTDIKPTLYKSAPEIKSIGLNKNTEKYRVESGDTISSIAQRFKALLGGTMYQRGVAFYKINMKSFRNNNINLLQAGALLVIPTTTEVTSIKRKTSLQAYYRLVSGKEVNFNQLTQINRRKKSRKATKIKATKEAKKMIQKSKELSDKNEMLNNELNNVAKLSDSDSSIIGLNDRMDQLNKSLEALRNETKDLNKRLTDLLVNLNHQKENTLAAN